ncbi:LamG-like jellyroll fold domain-containing protein [Micromonospora sp. WMMD735]|uniref:LamG-like jellyroll fold domain-containing protein n=1 Tax=Micromonospora sp. WMMD735 TaxID=3404130 RepID=UPI003B9670AA
MVIASAATWCGPAAGSPSREAAPEQAVAAPIGVAQAVVEARRTGSPVEATAAGTSTTVVTARPDGQIQLTEHVKPTRTRIDGQWKSLNPNLVRDDDGRITAAVTTNEVRLSPGGNQTLAEMVSGDRALTLGAPAPLPPPTLSGATATYRQVLPDVDLVVTVNTEGSFSHVFVVNTPEAATNSRLANLTLTTESTGFTLSADAAGNIAGRDRSGSAVITAAAPVMWDSTEGNAAGPSADRRTTASSPAAPGRHARTAPIKVKIKPGQLVLNPDRALLSSPKTVYPVYIDPTFNWTPTGSSKGGWATISAQHQSTNYWKDTPDPYKRMQVGNSGVQRSNTLINFSIPYSTLTGATINSALFKITNTLSWSCTAKRVDVFAPSTVLSSGNAKWDFWESQSSGPLAANKSFAYGYSGCAASGVSFDITGQIASDVTAKRSTRTLWLKAYNEASDTQSWKEFLDTSPTLEILYNHKPNTPTGLSTSPTTSCTAATPTVVGDSAVSLYAPVSDRNGGVLGVTFKVTRTSDAANVASSNPSTLTYPSGSTAVLVIPQSTLRTYSGYTGPGTGTATSFSWRVQATDFGAAGDWSVTCKFIFDPTRAGKPEVQLTSAEPTIVGQTATFGITPPSGGTAPSSYSYQLNSAPPVVIPASTGTTSITLKPTRFTNTLVVTSISAGGNIGDTAVRVFNSDPAATANDADMTGDGKADLITVGSANNLPAGLWLAENSGSLSINPNIVNIGTQGIGVATTSTSSDFDGSQVITGHFFDTGLQDVLVYRPTSGDAILLHANGDGSTIDSRGGDQQITIPPEALVDEAGTSPIQVANAGDGRQTGSLVPDLIGTSGDTTGGHYLTYYPTGAPGGYQQATRTTALTPTGGTDWNNWTIATAQTNTGTAMFLWNRSTGALHLWTDLTFDLDTAQLTYTSRTLATADWNKATALVLRAADINGDGNPDLWTTGASAAVTAWLVRANSSPTPVEAQPTQNLITSQHTWLFDEGTDGAVPSAVDSSGGKSLTATTTGALWRSGDMFSPSLMLNMDSATATPNTALQGELFRNEPLIDTTKSFSLSVWVKPTTAGGVIVSEDGANASRFILWNNTSDNTWRFGLGNADSGWSYTQVVTPAGTALGVWTHLVATYNAETRTISLYVNGVLKGSTAVTANPTWPSTGKFVVGRYKYQAAPTAYYAGKISNLQVWKRALTPTQAGASNTTKTGSLTPFGSTTWTPPGTGTVETETYAVDTAGSLWKYRKQGTQLTDPRLMSAGWDQFTPFGIADFNHDGYQDLIARDDTTCNLQVFLGTANDINPQPTFLGNGWCSFRPFGVTDWNRDGYQDIITASSTGDMWNYPGDLKGGQTTRVLLGTGWSTNYSTFGIANVVGDSTPDVYARLTSTGILNLYDFPPNNVSQVGTGWGNFTSFGLTDFNSDGKPDVIARDNSTGTVYLYPGTANGLLSARTTIATGW